MHINYENKPETWVKTGIFETLYVGNHCTGWSRLSADVEECSSWLECHTDGRSRIEHT